MGRPFKYRLVMWSRQTDVTRHLAAYKAATLVLSYAGIIVLLNTLYPNKWVNRYPIGFSPLA